MFVIHSLIQMTNNGQMYTFKNRVNTLIAVTNLELVTQLRRVTNVNQTEIDSLMFLFLKNKRKTKTKNYHQFNVELKR